MLTETLSAPGLKLQLEEKAEETIVRCSGKITAESAEMFQNEIRGRLIPESRGKGVAVNSRIVLDLSNVTYIDSTGLGALLGLWTAGQRRSCDLEIANLSPRMEKLGKHDQAGPGLQQDEKYVCRARALQVTHKQLVLEAEVCREQGALVITASAR